MSEMLVRRQTDVSGAIGLLSAMVGRSETGCFPDGCHLQQVNLFRCHLVIVDLLSSLGEEFVIG
jgi:hypothetical protein